MTRVRLILPVVFLAAAMPSFADSSSTIVCRFDVGAKLSIEPESYGRVSSVEPRRFRFVGLNAGSGTYVNLDKNWNGKTRVSRFTKRIEILEDTDSDNFFLVSIFPEKGKSGGNAAVYSQQSYVTGLQNHYSPELMAGYCTQE